MRTSPQIYACEGQHSQSIGNYPLAKGQVFQRSQVGFTQSAVVSLNLVGWWSSRYEDPPYLVTNLSNGYQACNYFRRRFQSETFFSDQKSRGFNIHKSHLSDPLRLSRMLGRSLSGLSLDGVPGFMGHRRKENWADRSHRPD